MQYPPSLTGFYKMFDDLRQILHDHEQHIASTIPMSDVPAALLVCSDVPSLLSLRVNCPSSSRIVTCPSVNAMAFTAYVKNRKSPVTLS